MKKLIIVAMFAALAMPQSAQAQLELVAGFDKWAFDPLIRNATQEFGVEGTWNTIGGNVDNQHTNGQTDGTWGSLALTPAADITADESNDVSRFVNGSGATYEFTLTDTSGAARDLGFFSFDGGTFRPLSSRNWELSVLSGDLTAGVVASGEIDAGGGGVFDWTDVDVSLADLVDSELDANGTVTFGLAFTGGGTLDEQGMFVAANGHHGYLDNVAIGTGVLPDPVVPGDFNDDGNIDALDIDAYIGNLDVAADGELAKLDLNTDGQVTLADHEQLVTQLVTAGGIAGTALGDANLDGVVDVLGDAATLVNNIGGSGVGWAEGDFNADGSVTVLGDAAILINNLGASNAPAAAVATSAVPEPSSLSLLALAGVGAMVRRRR